jgi:hypothetical protein
MFDGSQNALFLAKVHKNSKDISYQLFGSKGIEDNVDLLTEIKK